jgi:hypothetical protein
LNFVCGKLSMDFKRALKPFRHITTHKTSGENNPPKTPEAMPHKTVRFRKARQEARSNRDEENAELKPGAPNGRAASADQRRRGQDKDGTL